MEGVEGLLQDLMKEESFLQNTGIGKIFGKDELDVDSDDSEEVDEATGRVTRDTSEARVNEKKEQVREQTCLFVQTKKLSIYKRHYCG